MMRQPSKAAIQLRQIRAYMDGRLETALAGAERMTSTFGATSTESQVYRAIYAEMAQLSRFIEGTVKP